MIIYRKWKKSYAGRTEAICDGWFLFGFIPLYVREYKA